MNRNEQNSRNGERQSNSVSSIRSEASSNDASSGKSSSGREPQQGTAIDNSAKSQDAQRGSSSPDSSFRR